MADIYPDLEWYKKLSSQRSIPSKYPFANVHKCHRYYSSLYLLGELQITTTLATSKVAQLDKYWKGSGLIPVIEEHEPAVGHTERKLKSVDNFCPEVTFSIYGVFAEDLYRYVDCEVYTQLPYNNKKDGKAEDVIEMKPGVMGFSINLKALYKWLSDVVRVNGFRSRRK